MFRFEYPRRTGCRRVCVLCGTALARPPRTARSDRLSPSARAPITTRPRPGLTPCPTRSSWPTAGRSRPLTCGSTSVVPSCCGSSTTEVYGAVPEPPRPIKPSYRVHSEDKEALGGKAVRREVTIAFTDQPDGPRMDLLIYLPKAAGPEHRVPAFLGLNFSGNHAVQPRPGDHALAAVDAEQPREGHHGPSGDRGDAGLRSVELAGRADHRSRLCPGDGLLRRHRPRLRRRVPERSPSALLPTPARPDPRPASGARSAPGPGA